MLSSQCTTPIEHPSIDIATQWLFPLLRTCTTLCFLESLLNFRLDTTSAFSCQVFMLTGSHPSSIGSLSRASAPPLSQPFLLCSSISAGVTRSLLLSAVCVSCEEGSLTPSIFSLSTQLLALAIHRHTVDTHTSAAYNF